MITHNTKWFFIGSNESSGGSITLNKIEYSDPFFDGDPIAVDCGQVGQVFALDVATATLNASTVPDEAFDCACCAPVLSSYDCGSAIVDIPSPYVPGNTVIENILDDATYNGPNTSHYLSIPDSDDWRINSDYCIEFWCYFVSSPGDYRIISQGFGSSDQWEKNFAIWLTSNNKFRLSVAGQPPGESFVVFTSSNEMVIGQWYHIAFIRYSGYLRFYVNGEIQGSQYDWGSSSLNNSTSPIIIGRYSETSSIYYMTGYLDGLRISKGTSRWTSNFIPPEEPCEADSYTKLLLNFENNFTDSSGQGHIVTNNGVVFSSSIKKFGTYSALFADATIILSGQQTVVVPDCGQIGQIFANNDAGSAILEAP